MQKRKIVKVTKQAIPSLNLDFNWMINFPSTRVQINADTNRAQSLMCQSILRQNFKIIEVVKSNTENLFRIKNSISKASVINEILIRGCCYKHLYSSFKVTLYKLAITRD